MKRSPSLRIFSEMMRKSENLIFLASNLRLKSQSDLKETLLKAALSIQVAALEVYFKELLRNYFDVADFGSGDSLDYHHRILLKGRWDDYVKKVNSINATKARELMLYFSGFDVIQHWNGIKFGAKELRTNIQVFQQFNEIVEIRHSFAHGLPMKQYHWLEGRDRSNLSCKDLHNTKIFLSKLVAKNDMEFIKYLQSVFPTINLRWH